MSKVDDAVHATESWVEPCHLLELTSAGKNGVSAYLDLLSTLYFDKDDYSAVLAPMKNHSSRYCIEPFKYIDVLRSASRRNVSRPRLASPTMSYVVLYVLILTFQYQVAKDGLNYASPFVLTGMRYLIASFLIFGIVRRFRPILNKDTILLSLFTWASTVFWTYGLEYVSPAESAVLSYTMPLFSIPLSSIILSEKPTTNEWSGTVGGFVGVLIYSLSFGNHTFTMIGGVLTIVNAFFWAMYTIYSRKLRTQELTMTVATQLLLVALVSLLFAPLNYKLVTTTNLWFDLAYLSILSGVVCFFLWSALARLRKIGKTSTLIYLVPVTVTLVQSVQTSVIPDHLTLTGLGLMTLGIYISNGTIALQANAKRLRPRFRDFLKT